MSNPSSQTHTSQKSFRLHKLCTGGQSHERMALRMFMNVEKTKQDPPSSWKPRQDLRSSGQIVFHCCSHFIGSFPGEVIAFIQRSILSHFLCWQSDLASKVLFLNNEPQSTMLKVLVACFWPISSFSASCLLVGLRGSCLSHDPSSSEGHPLWDASLAARHPYLLAFSVRVCHLWEDRVTLVHGHRAAARARTAPCHRGAHATAAHDHPGADHVRNPVQLASRCSCLCHLEEHRHRVAFASFM